MHDALIKGNFGVSRTEGGIVELAQAAKSLFAREMFWNIQPEISATHPPWAEAKVSSTLTENIESSNCYSKFTLNLRAVNHNH